MSFSFGGAAAPVPAPVAAAAGGGFSFGALAAPAPAAPSAPAAPAPASGATTPTPTPAFSFAAAAPGPAAAPAPAAAAGAPAPAPAPATAAPGFSFASGPAPAPAPAAAGGALVPAQPQQPQQQQQAQQPPAESPAVPPRQPAIKVDLRALFQGVPEALLSDAEVAEQLDLLVEPGEPALRAERRLVAVLADAAFRERVLAFFDERPEQRFDRPPDVASAQLLEEWAAGKRRLPLLHGWGGEGVEAASLRHKEDLVEGVRSLSRFLRLAEPRALQVLHLYLLDRLRRGGAAEVDSRDLASPALHERVLRFHQNQRVFLLKNLQEVLRIDLDPEYARPEVRAAAQALLDALEGGDGLAARLQGCFSALCEASPPRVQELSQAHPALRSRRSPAWWEQQRREWVEHNLLEQSEVLTLLLLAVSGRAALGFGSWCRLLLLWKRLRMGELAPEKAYLLAQDAATQRRARRVAGLMALVAIHGLQLGHLLPPSDPATAGADHPFAADLKGMGQPPHELEELLYAMRDAGRAEALPSPELIAVVLLFLTCFLHLAAPALRGALHPDVQRLFDRAPEFLAVVTQRAAQAHLAELVAALLLDDEAAAATALDLGDAGQGVVAASDQWARLGFKAVLRRDADRLRPAELSRLDVEAVQVPLSDAVNALVAACYSGLQGRGGAAPLHRESMTTRKLEFLVFLTASVYHGHDLLCLSFWQVVAEEADGGMEDEALAGHPLQYLLQQARERHPLLFFHLVAAMVCDADTAARAAVALGRAPLCTAAYHSDEAERAAGRGHVDWDGDGFGGMAPRPGEPPTCVVAKGQVFDMETGVVVPDGTKGKYVSAAVGMQPRLVRWAGLSVWAALVRQLEDFCAFLGRARLRALVDALDGLRRRAAAHDGHGLGELGFNTVIDRCPSLFVYAPCPPRAEEVARETLRRGAWGVVRASLRRVEMLVDQLAVLLTLALEGPGGGGGRRGAGKQLLAALGDAPGMAAPDGPPLAERLPGRLLELVRVVAEAMSPAPPTRAPEGAEAQALVDLEAASLNLLARLARPEAPVAWRGPAVQALMAGVGDDALGAASEVNLGDGTRDRVPVVVWLGLRSMEAERAAGQYRITRAAVTLLGALVSDACDANWAGKDAAAAALPAGLNDEAVAQLVGFAVRVLLTLDHWTFARPLDRWLLSLACLGVVATYVGKPFSAEDPGTRDLERHRQGLLDRFRRDGALLRVLLRCAEYLPAGALQATLEARARRWTPPVSFLDQLSFDKERQAEEEDEEDGGGGRGGLFLARDGVLPLAFEKGGVLGASASREETEVLERLGLDALQVLAAVLKHFLQQQEAAAPAAAGGAAAAAGGSALDSASGMEMDAQAQPAAAAVGPGALSLLPRAADVATADRAVGGRRPLVTHIALLAGLTLYPGTGGATGVRLAVAATDVLGLLVRYMQRLRRARQQELLAAIPDWPANLPYPFPPGVLEDILSVTDARGFRRGLFAALGRSTTSGAALVGMLDLLVDIVRLQPSLARHVVFFWLPQPANGNGDGKEAGEPRLEGALLAVLERAQAMADAELGRGRTTGPGLLVLASALRFLCVAIRRAPPPRRWELLAGLSPKVWDVLVWAVGRVELEAAADVSVAAVTPYCHKLSVHRYALEAMTLLVAEASSSSSSAGTSAGSLEVRARALREAEAAATKLGRALLLSGGDRTARRQRLRMYLASSFKPTFPEKVGRRAAGPNGEVPLVRFRLPDWGLMLLDSSPRRFGDAGFVYDARALARYLHTSARVRALGEPQRREPERAVRLLNQYYSIAAAQHMVNKAFKGLAQVLVARGGGGGVAGVDVASLALEAVELLLEDDAARAATADSDDGGSAAFITQSLGASGSFGGGAAAGAGGEGDEAQQRLRAERVDVARKMRQPMLELLLTVVDAYGDRLGEPAALAALDLVERAFERLAGEGALAGGAGSELLQLDLRQCLLTVALLLLLRVPSLRPALRGRRPLPQLGGILAYTVGSLGSLDAVLIEGTGASAVGTCGSDRVEAVLRTCVTLLGVLLSRGEDEDPDEDEDEDHPAAQEYAREQAEARLLSEMRNRRVLPTVLGYWAAASRICAAAFPALHDYTVSGAAAGARSTAAAAALADPAVGRALERLATLLRFLQAAAGSSRGMCTELLKEGLLVVLMEDPVVACLARAVEGGAQVEALGQLLYRRGYRADGLESPYYALWVGTVRLVGLVLHRLTRPHLGFEAVLALPPEERDPGLAYACPLRPEEAKVVSEVAGFWRRLSPLLLWPLGEDKILTLALLREADAVLALAREAAVHAYSWRIEEPQRAEELRAVIKALVVRTSVLLGQAMASGLEGLGLGPGALLLPGGGGGMGGGMGGDGLFGAGRAAGAGHLGTPLLLILGDAFAPISPREVRLLRRWEERRARAAAAEGAPEGAQGVNEAEEEDEAEEDLEAQVHGWLASILASALGYVRYTGKLRLPRRIPLSPQEAAQAVLAEGTRVWYREAGDTLGLQPLVEGVIQRRVREFNPLEAYRLGTYDIRRAARSGREEFPPLGVEAGVRPERVALVEDREEEEAAAAVTPNSEEGDLDLELADPATGVPGFNHGRLSVGHLLTAARYAVAALRALGGAADPLSASAATTGRRRRARRRAEREGQLTDLLIHALYLLLMAARAHLRAARRGRLPQGKDRLLPRYLAAVAALLWDACEWRAGRPRPAAGDGAGYEGGGGGIHHHHHHHHHDLYGGGAGGDAVEGEQRLNALRERVDALLAQAEQEEEGVVEELEVVLALACRTKGAPPGLGHWLVNEVRVRGHAIPLAAYAAALRGACAWGGGGGGLAPPQGPGADHRLPRAARELLDDMVEQGLPTLLRELDSAAITEWSGGGADPRNTSARRLLLTG